MDYKFSETEILFIYGRFKKERARLEQLKRKASVKSEIALYSSIIQKIEALHPNFSVLPG